MDSVYWEQKDLGCLDSRGDHYSWLHLEILFVDAYLGNQGETNLFIVELLLQKGR